MWTETNRDEWSVYLAHKSKKSTLQLDLHDKRAYVHTGGRQLTRCTVGAASNRKGPLVITLKSHHGKFVVAESNGAANANRAAASTWERFTLFHNADGTVSLRSHHGKYLVAEANGQANANRLKLGPWEKWRMIWHNDGTVSFKSHHGKFLVAESDGKLNANRTAQSTWEKFRISAL